MEVEPLNPYVDMTLPSYFVGLDRMYWKLEVSVSTYSLLTKRRWFKVGEVCKLIW